MSTACELSLIVPAHNEEHRLAATIRSYARALQAAYGDAFEIVVVANACSDRTADITRDTMRAVPQVRLVEISAAIGKGGAVLEGFRNARAPRIVFADADGATAAESLVELARGLSRHDVVIGSRRLPSSIITRHQALSRRVLGLTFVWTARLLFGLRYADTQCGAKACRGDAARRLAGLVQERHWTFDLDLLITAAELGLDVAEHPVRWADQPGSRLRLLPTLRTVLPSLWRLSRRQAATVTRARGNPALLRGGRVSGVDA